MNHPKGSILLYILLLLASTKVLGQDIRVLYGKVIDETDHQPIASAFVEIEDLDLFSITDSLGLFQIPLKSNCNYSVVIRSLGHKLAFTTLLFKGNEKRHLFMLTPMSYNIDEITVISRESKANGTASNIGQSALQHLQPTSFTDVLQLIPGGQLKNNNLSSPKWIRLREPNSSSSSSNKGYNNNSSFGTSFIVDGVPSTNDGNIPASSNQYMSNLDLSSKGQDLRLIPTDGVENITIIRGIPSVRYGEVTSGVVKIERDYKRTPLKIRLKSNPASKMVSIGKGVSLFPKSTLHSNFSLLDYKQDARNPKVNYKRYIGSLRFQYQNQSNHWMIKNQSSIDYTGSFDTSKRDEEVDIAAGSSYENDYNKISFSGSSSLSHTKSRWFSSFQLQYGISSTKQQQHITKAVNGERMPVLINRDSGVFYSSHLPTSYISNYVHDNHPLSLYGNMDINLHSTIFGVKHKLLMGMTWNYSKNRGRGEIYDINRPLNPSSGRPRDYSTIPSSNKLSLFVEDQFTMDIGKLRLDTRIGIRSIRSLGMSKHYHLSGKSYYDPRMNSALHLPSINIRGKGLKTTLYAGFGWHTKLPSISQLYPDLIYMDQIQLNYYSQQEHLRQINYKTDIIDPTNVSMMANRNKKVEIGLGWEYGDMNLQVTGYIEKMTDGLRSVGNYQITNYKLYDAESGPNISTLETPPTVDMFDYKEMSNFHVYPQTVNGTQEDKWGIEYQLDLGDIQPITSRISINGAWMVSKYTLTSAEYRHPEQRFSNKPYPYLGYYEWDRGQRYEQFNTNLRCDTHLKKYGLIFSSILQCMWYEKRQTEPNDGKPSYYIDKTGQQHPFTNQDITDPLLRFLYSKPHPELFVENVIPIAIDFNITVSKTISKMIELSFYINRILRYTPSYTNHTGYKVVRKRSPYFGMELNINI
ncbi:TonB-dependent receptor [Halosquirtibacter xylanolyticus]|uniref:TonB-dependent receptor plug domain-containing protein n=1 Tax=Halosquirtibacter xylanolyticus TaxID=3374599 RepID=UPI0037485446|nr:TonB-dependent receptor [Prolixibacteraceae bacterium]